MPELPDLVHIEKVLGRLLPGRRIEAARTGDPTVLRLMVREPFPACLVGRTIEGVTRRGHFMRFGLDGDMVLVVNAMLAGRYYLDKVPKSAALVLELDGGGRLGYADDVRMGKVYVARTADEATIPGYRSLGVDILSPAFTRERFGALIAKRRDQVRRFLMDKSAIASIGNAYADEILFEARVHPKTFCGKLAPAEIDALWRATVDVTRAAIDEVERRDEPIEVKVRDFLKVRGKDGKPCPRCVTKIRSARVGDSDSCFCPKCQPTDRKLFVDFSKLPGR